MRESLLEVVETVSDRNIFHDIALVENIGTSRRYDDVNLVFWRNCEVITSVDRDKFAALFRCESLVTHLLKESDDFGSREVQTGAGIDVGGTSVERTGEERRGEHLSSSTSATLFVNDFNRFDPVSEKGAKSVTALGPTESLFSLTRRVRHSIPRTS